MNYPKELFFFIISKIYFNELSERTTFKISEMIQFPANIKLNRQFFGFINIKYQMSQDYRLKLSRMEEKKKNKEGI